MITARASVYLNTSAVSVNDAAVSVTPVKPVPSYGPTFKPAIVMTNAVIVQMITVSTNGSSSDTRPSVIGSFVLTAE